MIFKNISSYNISNNIKNKIMEVKIIQQTKSLAYGGKQTHIFECKAVTHEIISYFDRDHFIKIYNDRIDSSLNDKYVLGIPETFWRDDKKEIGKGELILVSMDRGEVVENILCKDCKIYITSKGQTIDTLSI